ncbi:MAG: hypothetical protein NVSMB25_09750 [Thermoleophilaceae bacterium]
MVYGNYGGALVLMAIGAILRFAIVGHISGIALGTIGLILLLTGLAWLVIAALVDFSARRRVVGAVPVERERVVERDAPIL